MKIVVWFKRLLCKHSDPYNHELPLEMIGHCEKCGKYLGETWTFYKERTKGTKKRRDR